MKNGLKIRIWLLLSTFLIPLSAQSLKMDFSGIDQFWKVTGILEQDREPEESDWAALFSSPGYRELMRRESYYSEDSFRESFRLVFKPSLADKLRAALEKRSSRRLSHYARIKANKAELLRFINQLQSGELLDAALRKTKEYLPAGAMDEVPYPPVSFIFFDLDGRGYVPIIIDLAYAWEKGDALIDFLAHEAHHYYRNLNAAYDEGNIVRAHSYLINALDQLQIEGIADQIDKHVSFFRNENPENTRYAEQYRKNVDASPDILRKVNLVFERMAGSSEQISRLSSELNSLIPQSGHPTGYYMARAIINSGNRSALIETAGNPFAFIYLYNRAALSSEDHPIFSGKSIEFLRSLEKVYCPRANDSLWIESSPQGLDFSAVDGFWRAADILIRDGEPSREEWERLFQIPAYTELAKYERRRFAPGTLEDMISLAFKPTRAAELAEKSDQGQRGLFRHFLEIKKQRSEISSYLKQKITKEWMDGVIGEVKPFLPGNALLEKSSPQVIPAFFAPDLRYGYSVFVFDPLYGMNRQQSIEYYARLFVLKYYHDAVLTFDPMKVKIRDSGILDLFTALELNGFMESIMSKNSIYGFDPERKTNMDQTFENALQTASQQLGELDLMLRGMSLSGEKNSSRPNPSVRDLPLEGRPLGLYMANAVSKTFGLDGLKATFGNPFLFFQTYQSAALTYPKIYTAFSHEFMNILNMLEQEYSLSP